MTVTVFSMRHKVYRLNQALSNFAILVIIFVGYCLLSSETLRCLPVGSTPLQLPTHRISSHPESDASGRGQNKRSVIVELLFFLRFVEHDHFTVRKNQLDVKITRLLRLMRPLFDLRAAKSYGLKMNRTKYG